jgi:ribosomal protein L11 methyltransferase
MLSGIYIELEAETKGNKAQSDLLTMHLAEIGFESFTEENQQFQAYMPIESFDEVHVRNLMAAEFVGVQFTIKEIAAQNWNAAWEAGFDPVEVNEHCVIRAPFHAPFNDGRLELIIEPRMSFGTGHHATTRLICSKMYGHDFENKRVLDMGCGTGVLGILAAKRGAASVVGIDIEQWSAENAAENVAMNVVDMQCFAGDARLLAGKQFDVILANINRNILVADAAVYASVLSSGGLIFLSGFLKTDEPVIASCFEALDFEACDTASEADWLCLIFRKK